VSGARDSKGERRAAREFIAAYHQQQLRALLERVRDGFEQLDAGEIDEFELDDLIHRYKRSAAELWKFCGSSGGQWERAASTLRFMRERHDEPDWWEATAPRRA
jgi:hypothetical protein